MFTNIRPSSKVTPTIPPMPSIPEDCTAASSSEQVQKEQEEERQILYRKIEELERRNESLKEAVTAAEARYNAAANLTVRTPSPAGMARRENASDAITTDRTPSPAGMAQREEASAEKEAPTVGGLIREAMKVISEGKLGDGERISVERSELGTTVLIETLA